MNVDFKFYLIFILLLSQNTEYTSSEKWWRSKWTVFCALLLLMNVLRSTLFKCIEMSNYNHVLSELGQIPIFMNQRQPQTPLLKSSRSMITTISYSCICLGAIETVHPQVSCNDGHKNTCNNCALIIVHTAQERYMYAGCSVHGTGCQGWL